MHFSSPIRTVSKWTVCFAVLSLAAAPCFADKPREYREKKKEIETLGKEVTVLEKVIKENEQRVFDLQTSKSASLGSKIGSALGLRHPELNGDCHAKCTVGQGTCTVDDRKLLEDKIGTNIPKDQLCLSYFNNLGKLKFRETNLSEGCKSAVGGCGEVYRQEQIDLLKAENLELDQRILRLKERRATADKDLDDIEEDCPDCQYRSQMRGGMSAGFGGAMFSSREPTTGEVVVGALGALAPVAMSGMSMGLGAMSLNASQSMYGNYLNQCMHVGVPCSAPGMGMMGGGMMMGGMGMMGGGMMGGMGMMPMGMGMMGGGMVSAFGGGMGMMPMMGGGMGMMTMMPTMMPVMMPVPMGMGMGMGMMPMMGGGMGMMSPMMMPMGMGGGMVSAFGGGMGMMPMMGGGMGMMPMMGGGMGMMSPMMMPMGMGGGMVSAFGGGMGMMPMGGGMGMMPMMGGGMGMMPMMGGGMGMMPMMGGGMGMMPMMGGMGMPMSMVAGMGGGMGMMPMAGGMGMMPMAGGMSMMPMAGGMGMMPMAGGMGMMPMAGGMGMMPMNPTMGSMGMPMGGGMSGYYSPYQNMGYGNPQYQNSMNLSMQNAMMAPQYAMQQQQDVMIAQQQAAQAAQRVYQLQGYGGGSMMGYAGSRW